MAKLKNVHPGEVLQQEFLVPLNISRNALAQAIGVPSRRVSDIVAGRRPVDGDMALRLAKAFGMSERFFLDLQADYDLDEARKAIAAELKKVERLVTSDNRRGIV